MYAQTIICQGEWIAGTSLGFWDANRHVISAKRPDHKIVNKKENKQI